jgi:cytochrome c553
LRDGFGPGTDHHRQRRQRQQEDVDVHRLPRHRRLPVQLSRSAQGSQDPTLRAVADSLTDQDIADLAAYYAQLGVKAGDAPPAAVAKAPSERVQALISRDKDNACTKCHGANFNTPNDGTVPKLAGQYSDYLYVALKSYKIENHAQLGRSNGVMSGQAKKYSNAELKDLASYVASLPGEVKTVPESRFHTSAK